MKILLDMRERKKHEDINAADALLLLLISPPFPPPTPPPPTNDPPSPPVPPICPTVGAGWMQCGALWTKHCKVRKKKFFYETNYIKKYRMIM